MTITDTAPTNAPDTRAPEATPQRRVRRKLALSTGYVGLVIALLAAMVAGVGIGSVALSPIDIITAVGERALPGVIDATGPAYVDTMIFESRLPRVLLAVFVGAGLAMAGMAMQAVVRNPLADPYLLGVSSGASVGAVLAIVFVTGFLGRWTISLFAFAGSLVSMVLVYLTARAGGRITTLRLILAGVAVAYVLSAVTSLLLLMSPNAQHAKQVMTWLMGSLGGASWDALPIVAGVVVLGLLWLYASSRRLNLMFAGDDAAATMGLNVARFRVEMFLLCSLLTGVLVAASGPIGFVGLMIPHATRILFGADHRAALPAAALVGATFLIVADIAARSLASPMELPVGILTAVCGGPFFIWLIWREGNKAKAVAA